VSWEELPVVVTVAPVGAEVTRADNPALPHTPAEIAAEVAACAEAGASECHLHVREEDGSPSSRRTELGIGLEAEMFDVGHVVSAVRTLERGELPPPLRANLVFGVPGGIDAAPEALAILHGAGGVRVGFEDDVYLRCGMLAASNAELVADACELVRTLGRRPATIEEARELLACPVG
jgi:uncharacterized protein (DUF849 family)